MIEMFQNIWLWICNNHQSILTFLTSAEFVTTAGAVFALWKQSSAYKNNTLSVNNVNASLNQVTSVNSNVNDIKDVSNTISKNVSETNKHLNELDTKLNSFMNSVNVKINSILDVQSIVYSTIRDENIRNTVNTIVTSAKYEELTNNLELQKELTNLKSKMTDTIKSFSQDINICKEDDVNVKNDNEEVSVYTARY